MFWLRGRSEGLKGLVSPLGCKALHLCRYRASSFDDVLAMAEAQCCGQAYSGTGLHAARPRPRNKSALSTATRRQLHLKEPRRLRH